MEHSVVHTFPTDIRHIIYNLIIQRIRKYSIVGLDTFILELLYSFDIGKPLPFLPFFLNTDGNAKATVKASSTVLKSLLFVVLTPTVPEMT